VTRKAETEVTQFEDGEWGHKPRTRFSESEESKEIDSFLKPPKRASLADIVTCGKGN
jgi:hypothetical protein